MNFELFLTDIRIQVVFGACLLFLLIQLWYFLFYFSRLAFVRQRVPPLSTPPVSVIICARNEAENLEKNLPEVFAQDYPDFEVIVINDCSWDNTEGVLETLKPRFPRLKVIHIKEDVYYSHGKKLAIMVGIKGASSEYLLFTDADCRPASHKWIQEMVRGFDQEKSIMLGYGPYEKRKGFLNKLIRFDTWSIGLMYLSFALARRPYMGVGRNMAYRRSLFFMKKGFSKHYFIESGDDDLFVNEAATGSNTLAVTVPEAFTYSIPKTTFRQWIFQKKRHTSTFKYYKLSNRLRLTLFGFSQYGFYISLGLSLIFYSLWPVTLGIFLFRHLMQMIIFKKSMNRLKEQDLFFWYPVLELCLMVIYPWIYIVRKTAKASPWKI